MESDVIEEAVVKYGWSEEKIDKYCITGKQFIYMVNLFLSSKTIFLELQDVFGSVQ